MPCNAWTSCGRYNPDKNPVNNRSDPPFTRCLKWTPSDDHATKWYDHAPLRGRHAIDVVGGWPQP
jgi:hypothetical protein